MPQGVLVFIYPFLLAFPCPQIELNCILELDLSSHNLKKKKIKKIKVL